MPATKREEGPPPEPPPSPEALIEAESFGPALRRLQADDAPKLAELTEAALLGVMAKQADSPAEARDAWAELYRRHDRYLSLIVSKSPGGPRGDAEVSDLVVDTFRAAFEWAGREGSEAAVAARFDDSDRDSVRRRVLGWLSVIARRLAIHEMAGRGERTASLNDSLAADAAAEEPPSSGLLSSLPSALATLSRKELDALRASLPWYEPESGEFELPKGEAAALASSLGITPEALRQRRHRSLARLQGLLRGIT